MPAPSAYASSRIRAGTICKRAMLMFVYNRLDNTAQDVSTPRPAFLAEPDPRPLQPLPS